MIDFGSRLREIRKSKGITQKQLAIAIGASERGIQNYELNERKPAFDVLCSLSKYFDVSIDYLLGNGICGKIADNPEVKPILANEIDLLLGHDALSRMNIDSTASLSDSDFCQLAASLLKDFTSKENALKIYWKL